MTTKADNVMREIDEELEHLWGPRCADFEISCTCCRAWRTRDDLAAYLEDNWEEEKNDE